MLDAADSSPLYILILIKLLLAADPIFLYCFSFDFATAEIEDAFSQNQQPEEHSRGLPPHPQDPTG